MEIAYGHAGFLGKRFVHNVQAVAREHHLMHPIQRLYGTAKPVEIRYEVAGQFVTASVALVVGDTTRQRIRYDSGLTLWVNWRAEPWSVENLVLPQWGFLALGPGTKVCTCLRDGKVADYAECPEYFFADARTWFDLPYLQEQQAGREASQIADIAPDEAASVTHPHLAAKEADFKAHTNPSGTWIEFGAIGTDGAVKVNRETGRLTLYPYPRKKPFRVSLDLKRLVPDATPVRVQVRALAAGTQQDLGTVETKLDGRRLVISLGTPGAGRYVVAWQRE
jgi:hypothetical protein